MTRYIEPTQRTRQLFFLAAILWAGLVLFLDRLDQFLPPLSKDRSIAIDQILERSLWGTVLSTVFIVILSMGAIYLTQRAISSGQWPPTNMTVPFRAKVKEIRSPRRTWISLAVLLSFFAIQIGLSWILYAKKQETLEEAKILIKNYSQPTLPASTPILRRP